MGTLYDQPPREMKSVSLQNVEYFLQDVATLAKKHKLEKTDIIEVYKLMELSRKNDLFVANGDIHDEQMAGIGNILSSIQNSLQEIAEK